MPQLDFYTIQSQIFCLIFSIFIIYSFLLKYAMPAHDVYLRLRLKKIIHYKTQLYSLVILSLIFRERTNNYVGVITNFIYDFYKIYFNFLTKIIPLMYFINIEIKNIKNNKKKLNLKPLITVIKHSVRIIEKDNLILNRKILTKSEIKQLILLGLKEKK
jgi:hypothetical protein